MSIASALPLGATADRELITIHLAPPVDLKDVMTRLGRVLPQGISLLEAEILPENKKGPVIAASELIVEVILPDEPSKAKLGLAIEQLMGRSEILCRREKRGAIDIRPGIDSLELSDSPDGLVAHIRMTLNHLEFTVKPSEVIEALGEIIPGIRITSVHRSALLTDKS
jgi:radical SAM-linked protein